MKRELLIVIAVTFISYISFAQDVSLSDLKKSAATKTNTIDDTTFKSGWRKGATLNINLSQVSNNNWVAAGSDKFSLAVNGTLHAFATKKWGRNTWDNILDLNYGLVNTTTLGVRKVTDLLSVVSKYGYEPKGWKNVYVTVLGQLRSQLTDGYQYNYLDSVGLKRRNSGFFAPAYVTLAPGIDWHPKPWLSIFGSPASARWTFVSNNPYSYVFPAGVTPGGTQETPLSKLYGVDSGKTNRLEFGAFITITAQKEIVKNVTYNGKLDLYSNYLKNPQNIDVFWTNQFLLKVNKWLSASYEIDFLYDDDVKQELNPTHALGLQVLSTLGVGFVANF
ncbi:DUF3078 domain-containing protein [Ferruginibacter albus]|uniref:DUF3078 domain-containing protein n=1 Tax=Ferruginibacter albus TaxID=2875540 RepID=UPI001CC79861|nr:DUF3078 domain-containing protein [Ferruginibacter albus]UAY51754.1 DUF3078 domain-containing protein [Ferruginibacter albus]